MKHNCHTLVYRHNLFSNPANKAEQRVSQLQPSNNTALIQQQRSWPKAPLLWLLLLGAFSLSATQSYAEEVIPPEGPEAVKHHAGVRVNAQRSPYIGSDTEFSLTPLLQYNHGVLFAGDRVGLGSFIGYLDGWIVGLSASFGFADITRNNIDELDDLPDLRLGFAINLLTAKSFGRGDVAFSVSKELGDASDGWDADIFYFYTIDKGRWSDQPSLTVNSKNHKAVNYAYGVKSRFATADRPRYRGGSAFNIFPEMIVTYELIDNWRLHTSVAYLGYDSSIRNSPITDRNGRWSAYIGMAYHWDSPFPFQ